MCIDTDKRIIDKYGKGYAYENNISYQYFTIIFLALR